LRLRLEERAREESIAEHVAAIAEALSHEDLEAASRQLEAARSEYGDHDSFSEPEARLAELRARLEERALQAVISDSATAIAAELSSENLELARQKLEAARSEFGGNSRFDELGEQIDELEFELARKAQETALAEIVAAAAEHLGAHRLGEAAVELDRAREALATSEGFEEIAREIDSLHEQLVEQQAKLAQEEAQRQAPDLLEEEEMLAEAEQNEAAVERVEGEHPSAAELLAQAHELAEKSDFDRAEPLLTRALAIEPENQEIQGFLQIILAGKGSTDLGSETPELVPHADEPTLGVSTSELPPAEPFRDPGTPIRRPKGLRYLIAAILFVAAVAGIWRFTGGDTNGFDDQLAESTGGGESEARIETVQAPADPARGAVDLSPARMPTEDEGLQQPPPPVELEATKTDSTRAPSVVDISPAPAPSEKEVFQPPLPLIELGTILIKALPWAEVTSIVDEDGETYEVGNEPYTPFHRSLPAGRYVVRLENENKGAPKEVRVEVRAGELVSRTVEFERIDESAFLKNFEW